MLFINDESNLRFVSITATICNNLNFSLLEIFYIKFVSHRLMTSVTLVVTRSRIGSPILICINSRAPFYGHPLITDSFVCPNENLINFLLD